MKKLIIILSIFAITACSMVEIKPVVDLAERIAARRLAYEIAKNNPEIIIPGLAICDRLTASEGQEAIDLTAYATAELIKLVGDDPMLMADLSDLLSMIEIKPMGAIDIPKLKTAAVGFKQGLLMAREKAK